MKIILLFFYFRYFHARELSCIPHEQNQYKFFSFHARELSNNHICRGTFFQKKTAKLAIDLLSMFRSTEKSNAQCLREKGTSKMCKNAKKRVRFTLVFSVACMNTQEGSSPNFFVKKVNF